MYWVSGDEELVNIRSAPRKDRYVVVLLPKSGSVSCHMQACV